MRWFLPDWTCSLLILIGMIIILCHMKNYFRSIYLAFIVPGPPAYPLIGNALLVTNSEKLEYLGTNVYKFFGPIVRCWISVVPFFFVLHPSHLQILLCNGKLTKKNMFYTLLHNFIGEGLITDNGEKWKLHRKLIQPYFHINVLEDFIPTFAETSSMLVNRLQCTDTVNITSFINNWVLDTLHRAVLGIPMTDEDYESSPFRKGQLIVPYRISRPWMLLDFIFKFTKNAENEKKQKTVLHEFTKKIINSRKRQEVRSRFVSILDILMNIADLNPTFSEADVINETCTFMLAGQDSVGSGAAFALYHLAKNQDIQEKVYKEQIDVFGNDSRPPTMQDLNEMKYLEQCIKESLRLCPSVPIIARILTEDLKLGEHTIPAGANIFISPFATHRIESLYPDPLRFNPERFSNEQIHKIHPYGYIPFSAGPRNCIGYKFALMEIKTVISTIIRHFHLSLVPGKENVELAYRITLRAKGGIWLTLKKR